MVTYLGDNNILPGYLLMHNNYVSKSVPKEDLLIWNIKDGWEPLCTFLNKPIPEGPIPHDNKTGDTKFIEKYAHETDIMKKSYRYFGRAILIDSIKLALISYVGWKVYKTNGKWITQKINYSHSFVNKYLK